MSIVFDSGIWISAMQYGGVPLSAISNALLGDRVIFCTQLEDEIIRVMSKKFSRSPSNVKARMAAFLEGSIRIHIPGKLTGICRDPKDDFILECAVIGNAGSIVTGDKDLLSLAAYEGISIMTPRQYLDNARSALHKPIP